MINENICVGNSKDSVSGEKNVKFEFTELSEFTSDFDVVEDTETCLSIKQVKQMSSSCFGMVVYAVPTYYTAAFATPEILKDRHILVPAADVIAALNSLLTVSYHMKVSQIVAGHEHGTQSNKCHYQICVDLAESTRASIKPGYIQFEGSRLLYMAQKARNPYAIRTYCKKDGDFFYLYPDKAIKYVMKQMKSGDSKVDPFATVIQNKCIISKDDAKDLILTHEPRVGITMYKNIEYAIDSILTDPIPELTWTYPEHLVGKYPIIEDWFRNWCTPDYLDRRKALLLYSEKRAMGKTRFAEALVNHSSYVVVFRNTFTDGALKGKTPKLLILDDMGCYTKDNKETWKGLVASQKTAIRDAYMNYQWNFEIPCIITTNNKNLVKNLYLSDEFKTQIIFVEISDYMGPLGTEPLQFQTIEQQLSADTFDFIMAAQQERDEFNAGKDKIFLGNKRGADTFQQLAEKSKLLQAIIDKDRELANLRREVDKLKKLINK